MSEEWGDDMISEVNSFLGELFSNPKYNGDVSQKEDFNHQRVRTPPGDVIVLHASPSFKGGQSIQYWTRWLEQAEE